MDSAHRHSIDSSFTTNGVLLKDEFVRSSLAKITWIKVSLNAGLADDYSAVHRTSRHDFETVWSNLSFASNYRAENHISCNLGVQSLLLPDNVNSLHELARRTKDTGLDYLVLKPYVHNIYMNQPGYSDIDYTNKLYNDTINSLKQQFDDSNFTVIARLNALSKLNGDVDRYSKCWSTPSLWFYISGMVTYMPVALMLVIPTFFSAIYLILLLRIFGVLMNEKTAFIMYKMIST